MNIKLKQGSRLTVLSWHRKKQGKQNRVFVMAKCSCGVIKEYAKNNITTGNTYSCGCLNREKYTLDGASAHPLYYVWKSIIDRCTNSAIHNYHRYGGRGITVCNEWKNDVHAFIKWGLANGWQKGLQIDREKNNGNYTPENCRFVTPEVNSNNRENARLFTYNGQSKTLKDLASSTGINYNTLRARLYELKWSVEKSVETPT